MLPCYVFSEMNGYYSYQVAIVHADHFVDACAILRQHLPEVKIRGYEGYDPRLDVSTLVHITMDQFQSEFTKEEYDSHFKMKDLDKKEFLLKNYDRILKANHVNPDRFSREPWIVCGAYGISGPGFLNTETRGWYDWIEGSLEVPVGYFFTALHEG